MNTEILFNNINLLMMMANSHNKLEGMGVYSPILLTPVEDLGSILALCHVG